MSKDSLKISNDDKIENVLNYISKMILFRTESIENLNDYLSLSDAYSFGYDNGSLSELKFIEFLLKS